MRLFIALPLPEAIKTACTDYQKKMKEAGIQARYTKPENLHITLAFLGEQEPEPVLQVLRQIQMPPIQLETDGTGNFKSLLYAALVPNPTLETFAGQLRDALKEAGIQFDSKPFKAHVTLARNCKELPAFPFPDANGIITKPVLFESRFEKTGMKYIPLN